MISLIYIITMLIVVNYPYQTDKEVTVQLAGKLEVASSLLDMTEQAEVIVKGQYTVLAETNDSLIDTQSVHTDHTQKSLLNTYRFEIEEVIKGNPNHRAIYINHHYSDTVYVYEEEGSDRVVGTVEVINPLFIEPKEEQAVILFLNSTETDRYFVGATEPFIVSVNEKNELTLCSNLLKEQNASEALQTYRLKEGYHVSIETPEYSLEDTITGKCVSDIVNIINGNQLN